jgi:hypothetical protein
MGNVGMSDRVADIIEGYDRLGVHRTGSPVDDAGAEWLIERLAEAGVRATTDVFDFERLDVADAHVEVSGRRIEGTPLYDGGETDEDGVGGTLVEVGAATTGGKGPETIGYAEVDANPYADLAATRRSSGCAAIVLVPSPDAPLPGCSLLNAPDYESPFGPPVVQLSNEHGAELRAALGRPCRVTVRTRRTDVLVSNVVATVAGTDPGAAPLVVMTPRSSWWESVGERGGGIAVFLEIGRAIAESPCRRTVQFIASTGHELGHLGLDHHLAQHPDLAAGAHAWIHLGANFGAATRTHVIAQSSHDDLGVLLSDTMASATVAPTMVITGAQRPIGEAENIFDAGGRYVSLVGAQELFHHQSDRWPDNIDLDIVTRLAGAVSELAVGLAS